MSLRFRNLGSGSGGNATLVEASQGITRTRLLVDCGFSQRELLRRLTLAGSSPDEIDAVFITHEHGDHIGSAIGFCTRHRIPLFASRGTWRAVGRADFDASLLSLCRDGDSLELGDLHLVPFAVPHDANEPLQLRLDDGAVALGIITDLGSFTDAVCAKLAGVQALLLECNHDEGLLRGGNYPASLKRRIMGTHGHLSNNAAAALLGQVMHSGLRHVLASHLSEQNNSPALAREALAPVLGGTPGDVLVASQTGGFDWLSA
jgi:phosphoribosyl 1,2-cyclic phosphodiesterase